MPPPKKTAPSPSSIPSDPPREQTKVVALLTSHFSSHQRSPNLIPPATRSITIVKDLLALTESDEECDTAEVEETLTRFVDLSLTSERKQAGTAGSVVGLITALCSQRAVEDGGIVPGLDFLLYRGLVR